MAGLRPGDPSSPRRGVAGRPAGAARVACSRPVSSEQSSAEITLRLFVVARWVMLVLIAVGWTLQTSSPDIFT